MHNMKKPIVKIQNATMVDVLGKKRLCGYVYGHPRIKDGDFVATSHIEKVETKNTVYLLEDLYVNAKNKSSSGNGFEIIFYCQDCGIQDNYSENKPVNTDVEKVEQLMVQLAGCSVAAIGWIKDPAKEGDYGWSVPYQDVLQLRRKYDELTTLLNTERENAVREFIDWKHDINNIPSNTTVPTQVVQRIQHENEIKRLNEFLNQQGGK